MPWDPLTWIHAPQHTASGILQNGISHQRRMGLKLRGGGRVWLNPPYSRPLIERFVEKMVENNNGIALLFNRCDSKMFQDLIFPNATAIMFLRGRIKFYRPDGTQGDSPGCGSVLIAFGEENAVALEKSNIPGKFIRLTK